MKVAFCRACGRLILSAFIYCPYCGSAQRPGPGIEDATGGTFVRLEHLQRSAGLSAAGIPADGLPVADGGYAEALRAHIDELISDLDSLEADVVGMLGAGHDIDRTANGDI